MKHLKDYEAKVKKLRPQRAVIAHLQPHIKQISALQISLEQPELSEAYASKVEDILIEIFEDFEYDLDIHISPTSIIYGNECLAVNPKAFWRSIIANFSAQITDK